MRAREVEARLRREGFEERPGKGSHRIFFRAQPVPSRLVVVPGHRGDIPTGTLRSICKQAGWDWPPES